MERHKITRLFISPKYWCDYVTHASALARGKLIHSVYFRSNDQRQLIELPAKAVRRIRYLYSAEEVAELANH